MQKDYHVFVVQTCSHLYHDEVSFYFNALSVAALNKGMIQLFSDMMELHVG